MPEKMEKKHLFFLIQMGFPQIYICAPLTAMASAVKCWDWDCGWKYMLYSMQTMTKLMDQQNLWPALKPQWITMISTFSSLLPFVMQVFMLKTCSRKLLVRGPCTQQLNNCRQSIKFPIKKHTRWFSKCKCVSVMRNKIDERVKTSNNLAWIYAPNKLRVA